VIKASNDADPIAELSTPISRSAPPLGSGTVMGFPVTAQPGDTVKVGMPLSRVDGRAKVMGQARYIAEHTALDMSYGVVVSSSIAKGAILSIDSSQALRVPGVLRVITHENRPKMRSMRIFYKDIDSPGGMPFRPLHDERIHYSGQPVALVVAETFEAARHAASLVKVDYQAEPHETELMSHLARAHTPKGIKAGFVPPPKPKGDADAAFDAAPVKLDAQYHAGVEHHNPLEMHATTVVRDADGHLHVYDKTQSSENSLMVVKHAFGLSGKQVTVRNPFIGGAFGSGLRPQYQLLMAVMAALALQRSVKVVLTRQQMFTFGHRPEGWQRVRLAAETDGTLRAIVHEAIAETSRLEDYTEVTVNWSGQLYRCDNVRYDYKLVDLDHYTPLDMRAPGAAHGVHAIEVAMDELSYELQMDPLALRLKNYAEVDGNTDKPFSSKELRACYEQGAARFGWARRNPAPRSTKEGRELVGWGMATGTWDAMQMYANARAVLHADGSLVVSSATSDIGTGTYTAMSLIAAASLGIPIEAVTFQLGDSSLPAAPLEGGSWTVASVGSAVDAVCEKVRKRLLKLAKAMRDSPFDGANLEDVTFVGGELHVVDSNGDARSVAITELMHSSGIDKIDEKSLLLPNLLKQRKFTRATHSAVFVEVKVDEDLGNVRVTRVVSAIAAGRIISAKTARSQISGGVVWGISQALHEDTKTDHTLGRFMNHNLSEYHVAVNADIHDIDVIFVEEDDRIVSRLGAKGVGEIGLVGVAAAICNAIFHATGRRVRSLPITPDKVMRPETRENC
ncbi:MAG: Xanthine dehydrogenase, partial [Rhizobacter sp.]|nr:Xanthine dehydrogenase [Rhizobacter sp.]